MKKRSKIAKIPEMNDVLKGREDVCRMLTSDLQELEKRIQLAQRSLAAVESSSNEIQRLVRFLRPKRRKSKA